MTVAKATTQLSLRESERDTMCQQVLHSYLDRLDTEMERLAITLAAPEAAMQPTAQPRPLMHDGAAHELINLKASQRLR